MSVPMTDVTEFRPRGVVANEDAVAELRSLAGRYGLNPKRVYGLAMEFAAGLAETDDFETYVAQQNTGTGE